jgi:hypothetical protein
MSAVQRHRVLHHAIDHASSLLGSGVRCCLVVLSTSFAPFEELQLRHSTRMFDGVLSPPRESGVM